MVGGLIAITVTGVEEASDGSGFLAGYVTLLIKKVFSRLPDSLEGLKPVLFFRVFPIAVTGIIMMLVNPQLTKIYTGISSFLESLGGSNLVLVGLLVGLLLGGMMAIGMGGPFNKAAYTFGIAMLDAQNFNFIATVMAAGMVPPSAWRFLQRYSKINSRNQNVKPARQLMSSVPALSQKVSSRLPQPIRHALSQLQLPGQRSLVL